ncbi:MAG: GntR family transcriptional regulator [Terriglobales bacterium]
MALAVGPDAVTFEKLGLVIDNHSFVPYYVQIVDRVRDLVKKNKLREGQTFCSEGEIAQALGISKMPVRQAFQKLRAEGLLVIAKGKRPVVGSGRVPWNFQQLRGFSEEMRRRGLNPSAQLLSITLEDPSIEVAQALKLDTGERIYRARRLRSVNGEPVALVTSYLPARIFAGIEKQDLEKQSLYSIFEESYKRKLQWAEELIGAAIAGDEEAAILQASAGSALLVIRETTYDSQNVAIEHSLSLLRGDRYTASVISVRKTPDRVPA